VTPLRRLTGWAWLPRLRRMLGLFAFFYAALHASAYVALDHRFDWASIVEDIVKRPYLSFGFAAFVLMLPLAATSTDAMVRRLGGRNWLRLHRLVYASAVLAVVHYGFHKQAKSALADPLFYATLLALLLGVRVLFALRRRGAAAQGRQDSAASSSATVSRRRTS
jgi:sulfoxide reductase heme-binding subunit YedZ